MESAECLVPAVEGHASAAALRSAWKRATDLEAFADFIQPNLAFFALGYIKAAANVQPGSFADDGLSCVEFHRRGTIRGTPSRKT